MALSNLQTHILHTLLRGDMKEILKLRKKFTKTFDKTFHYAFGSSFGVEIEVNEHYFYSKKLHHKYEILSSIQKDVLNILNKRHLIPKNKRHYIPNAQYYIPIGKNFLPLRVYIDGPCIEIAMPICAKNLYLMNIILNKIKKDYLTYDSIGSNRDETSSMHIHTRHFYREMAYYPSESKRRMNIDTCMDANAYILSNEVRTKKIITLIRLGDTDVIHSLRRSKIIISDLINNIAHFHTKDGIQKNEGNDSIEYRMFTGSYDWEIILKRVALLNSIYRIKKYNDIELFMILMERIDNDIFW